jgi:hypothetical protein
VQRRVVVNRSEVLRPVEVAHVRACTGYNVHTYLPTQECNLHTYVLAQIYNVHPYVLEQ